MAKDNLISIKDKFWYKDAIIYQAHVKVFMDSNEDGIGDFKGLKMKLDYLKDLGITAIWLLPFFPSPLKDDGYDISDYLDIHEQYGNLRDVKDFIRAAHERDIKVITEVVLNHTSDQHSWFQASRRGEPGSKSRNFYIWSDNPDKYKEARIIFKDFESSNWTWDSVAKAYYWHRFYSHQPDLNFRNPSVQKEVMRVIDYWLKMGVDGLRLDAAPYLFEREGTNCENLPETHEFLKKLRDHVDKKFGNRMLLAEANQWPADAVGYFGKGKECNMAFHFPLMPRMFMALQMEDRFPIIDILENTPKIPNNCQWATFLRNHDELTLEMVTDEERDYMYGMYARDSQMRVNFGIRRRLAPLLENDRRKIELMNILLFTLVGTPVIYYGDEIGMGDNYYLGDRNGVRTPMQWSADANAGFSKTNPQRLYLPLIIDPEYHYETINVGNQLRNQSSLLWWMKRIIAIRKNSKAFGRGTIKFLFPHNNKILAFIREYNNERFLVVVNLSRHPQATELDLAKFAGCLPQETFGGEMFPAITESPYAFTLSPYGYYIFSLKSEERTIKPLKFEKPPLQIKGTLDNLSLSKSKEKLQSEIIPKFLKKSSWFANKSQQIEQVVIKEILTESKTKAHNFQALIISVNYKEKPPETYFLPVAFAFGYRARQFSKLYPESIISTLILDKKRGVIFDGIYDQDYRRNLLVLSLQKRNLKGKRGKLVGIPEKFFKKNYSLENIGAPNEIFRFNRNSVTLLFGDKLLLKLFREIEEGIHPEIEVLRYLRKRDFPNVYSILGEITYTESSSKNTTVGIVKKHFQFQENAWELCSGEVDRYFERVLSVRERWQDILSSFPALSSSSVFDFPKTNTSEEFNNLTGQIFIGQIRLLGKNLGELHVLLASEKENPYFRPVSFGQMNKAAFFQSMMVYAKRILQPHQKTKITREEVRKELDDIIQYKEIILNKLKDIQKKRIDALMTRIHGNLHLSKILYTGKDFFISDFEGDPLKSLSNRRLKNSPLIDVAGIIRSLHYVSYKSLFTQSSLKSDDIPLLESWADIWYKFNAFSFLDSYLETVREYRIVPKKKKIFIEFLGSLLLDKALHELEYELNNRPEWAIIPIRGIKSLVNIT